MFIRMGEPCTVDALRSVNLEVAQDEFVAIMGPSGSGKSTLLHLPGGLDSPTDGDATLSGKRMTHLTDNEITLVRRRQVGFIFQFFNLLLTLSAAENIALPLLLDGKNIQDYVSRIDELLALVGLTDRRDHKPDQLSGGQQQRIAIARAFVYEPPIVLADEPTGNLDSKSAPAFSNSCVMPAKPSTPPLSWSPTIPAPPPTPTTSSSSKMVKSSAS